jgi:hypothetical protein
VDQKFNLDFTTHHEALADIVIWLNLEICIFSILINLILIVSQTNSEETITLHSAQGQQTVTISPDNLPQTITIQSTNVLLKQPNRQWQEQVHIHLVFKTFVYTTILKQNLSKENIIFQI